MIFNDAIFVYCEGYTEHTDSLCGPNAFFVKETNLSFRVLWLDNYFLAIEGTYILHLSGFRIISEFTES
jgi:hypothetical protein